MKQYEVTFIVDPVLSGEEIKAIAQTYVDLLKSEGCEIVHIDEMGLRPLAYPINKRNSGVYYCIEFTTPNSKLIDNVELALRRDERIMRFLTVSLDKYGIKYNADKRGGLIGKAKKGGKPKDEGQGQQGHHQGQGHSQGPRREAAEAPAAPAAPAPAPEPTPAPAPVAAAPAPVAPVVAAAPAAEEEE